MNDQLVVQVSPSKLLELGIEKGISMEQLEKLMELQERWDAQQAKKTFLISMSLFQSKCPVMIKDKTVSYGHNTGGGSTKYKYATLGGISASISGLLLECGLSYRWDTQEGDKGITITCTVSHVDGHSEQNAMTAKKDDSGKKNLIQQQGSTITYLQRYTLIGALGISTADNDPDGQKPVAEKPKSESSAVILKAAKDLVDAYETCDEVQDKGRILLQNCIQRGLSPKHKEVLTNHITRKFNSLKPDPK